MSNTIDSGVALDVGLGAGSGIRILSGFFIGHILLLKSLRILFLALRKTILGCLEKIFFQLVFYLYSYHFIY